MRKQSFLYSEFLENLLKYIIVIEFVISIVGGWRKGRKQAQK